MRKEKALATLAASPRPHRKSQMRTGLSPQGQRWSGDKVTDPLSVFELWIKRVLDGLMA